MSGTAIPHIVMVPASWAAPGGSPDTTVTVTEFFDQYAGRKRETVITLADLADRLRKTTQRQKETLPWVKMARFGDAKTDKGSLRHDANILAITGIEADYDGEAFKFVHAVEILTTAGIKAIAYTSPSHKAAKPRWRILCPLSQEHPPNDRDKFMGRLNGLFAGIFSAESWAWSQSYFYGSVRQNKDHSVELIDGDPIDERDDLDEHWTGKPDTTKPNGKGNGQHEHASGPLDTSAMLKAMREGTSYHMPMVRLAGYAACNDTPLLTIRKTITDAMESVYPDQRDARWRNRMDDLDRCLVDIYGKEFVRQASGAKTETAAGNTTTPTVGYSLAALQGEEIRPMAWIVPNYVPEGLTIFAGRPKIGKSWFVLDVGLGVGRGTEVLGEAVEPGDVLYYALEDGKRRMQSRVSHILGPNVKWPANVEVRHRLDPLDAGGLDEIDGWLNEHPAARLVVIDVFGRVRGMKTAREEQYQYDYRILAPLQQLATRRRIAIIVVHHVRKSDATDVLDTVSGTTGIAGAGDNIMVLGRAPTGTRLYIRGRDTEECDKLVEFDPDTGIWAVTGDFDEADPAGGLNGIRKKVFDLLQASPTPLTPAAIAERTTIPGASVRQILRRMTKTIPSQAIRHAEPANSYVAGKL
jgi:hypothetical protein